MDSALVRSSINMQTQTCLVLMFKSPHRSKQRLAAEIGSRAQTVAEHLFECAVADLEAWPGPTCFAPAKPEDLQFARERRCVADLCTEQGSGNLGERIGHVNLALRDAGHSDQLFIGIDCPALDLNYLTRADAVLRDADVVLGPADDGGVVLMGVRGKWPELGGLPWSTPLLRAELVETCRNANLHIATLEAHGDVDCARDLQRLPGRLKSDDRPSRRRLCDWIESESFA
jgi:glycosyltransferase A (GT-A) superfamily protein (DUF2064 family)